MNSKIVETHKRLVEREISCVELISEHLKNLESSNKNTANFLLSTSALKKAALVDKKIQKNDPISLFEGIPFGLKDVYLLQGEYASGSSEFLRNYKSPYTGTAVQKLLDVGAIPIVKENCDSFGHGSTNENSAFGRAKHFEEEGLVAGGSSGGSAVNVAAGYTIFSLGGDTGGSIRQPAGYNQIYGFKPSYGRISRFGIMAYASSTDVVGPLALTLEDIRLITNIISGKDIKDQTTFTSKPIGELRASKPQKIGYYKSFIDNHAIDAAIKSGFLELIEKVKSVGVEVVELEFYDLKTLVSTYYVLAMAETASNLARLDGTTYGERLAASSLKEVYSETRSKYFTEETKTRIVGGNQVLSQGLSEEIYLKAAALREDMQHHFEKDFQEVDIILSPVTPNKTPKAGENLMDPLAMYLSDAYTVGFSLGGLPTLVAPYGTETGVQISAGLKQDAQVLDFAKFLESIL